MNNQARVAISAFLLLASIGASLYFYGLLPDRVPIHFNADNQPNGWGPKNMATAFPVGMELFLCVMYAIGIKAVEDRNYLQKKLKRPVSEEYMVKMIRNSQGVLDWVFLITMTMFLTIQIESFLTGLGKMSGLSGMWVFIAVLLAGAIYGSIKGLSYRSEAFKEADRDPNKKLPFKTP
jgi:uncharacterized membrane protein